MMGSSIGNLFTGDAPRAVLTMSRLGGGRRSAAARQTFAWFLTNPNGFTRGVIRTVAEVAKERWQAARQNRLNVLPRVHRGWTYAGLRAATNVLQRDLNTAVVAEEMRKGTKSIYVDYVDYDEIAHHAGMFRPESLAALDGLDRVLGTLERLSTQAARRYHIVVSLTTVSPRARRSSTASAPTSVRYAPSSWRRKWPPSTLRSKAGDERIPSPKTWRAPGLLAEPPAAPPPPAADTSTRAPKPQPTAAISVLGSGNLGLLYVHSAVRLTLEDLQERWPSLVPGLCAHEGVGFIAGLDSAGVPWVLGEQGRVRLDTGKVTGQTLSGTVRRPCSPDAPARGRDAGGARPVHQQPRQRTSRSISRHSNRSSVPTGAWAAGRIVRSC